jgi:YhgE/Pip-like protein
VTEPGPSPAPRQVRAAQLLKVPMVWLGPTILASVLIFVVTLVYFGSLVDPTAHLHGLPVSVVNQDVGASLGTQRINIGQQVEAGLKQSSAVSSRLTLDSEALPAVTSDMNRDQVYAAIVIPPRFTESLLTVSGLSTSAARSPAKPTIQMLTNPRAGTLGVSLAIGVTQPALQVASRQIGQRLLPVAAASGTANAATRALLADPVTLAQVPYKPLPPQSGLGLSAFYVSLLTIFCGFLGAIIVNSSLDAVLGYATTEIGPRWRQRPPLPVSRLQTLLTKWAVATPLTLVLTGLLLAAAVGVLGMDAPHFWQLWLFTWFAAASVAIGTLALFAALGTLGQLVALLVFIYLSLASSGGTVPLEALSAFYRFLANFEPLRQILDGVRAILYFDGQFAAGLTRGLVTAGLGLVFWLVLGTVVTIWYDRRGLYRIEPALMAYVNQATRQYIDQRNAGAPADGAEGRTPTATESPPTPTAERQPDEPRPPAKG